MGDNPLRGPTGKWGLYDTVDKAWLGDGDGPARYYDERVARIAAEVTARMSGWSLGRVRAREYDGTGTRKRDQVPVVQSASEALRDMERGK